MNKILNKVKEINWSKYENDDYYGLDYDPNKIPEVLEFLINAKDSDFSETHDDKDVLNLVYAFGHDHAGLYYPVLFDALDLLIEIEQSTSSKKCKNCLIALFNDYYYFSPDIGKSKLCIEQELQDFVRNKLEPYSDENLNMINP